MHTKTVIHEITEIYRVIEYQVIDNDETVNVFFKVSYLDDEFEDKFDKLSEAIAYINNLTFK
jgi:hypothetical protein